MADWTTPPWAQLVAGKPWTDEKAAAAFENAIAIAEGADDAPRIRIGALQRLTAGTSIRSRRDATATAQVTGVNLTANLTGLEFGFLQSGTVRVTFDHEASGASGTAQVIRTRNGSDSVLATYTNSGSWVSRSVDAGVLPGDRLRIAATSPTSAGGGGSTVSVSLRNCRISTGGEDLFPGIPAPLEGNTYA